MLANQDKCACCLLAVWCRKDTDLGEYRQDWSKVSAWVNELQSDKVLHNGFIVAVNQVANGLHHTKLDIVINLGDQAKVQNGQAAVRGPDQVAWVWVSLHAQQRGVSVTHAVTRGQLRST